ncbi:MAG: hypothetical protein LWW98_08595 [Deltaproteobacteria bacterium]|nr:hypothetical protein [Deltaproteobacteria bacterium]
MLTIKNYHAIKERGRINFHVPYLLGEKMRKKRSMNKCCFVAIVAILTSFFLCACGGSRLPIEKIRASLKNVPTYSIVLEDMKEEGNLFKTHYHKYHIIMDDKTTKTDWLEVPENYFKQNTSFLGMTIWVKKEGKESKAIGPPGYEYVGNERYGQWNTNSSGQSFWAFYGQYHFISALLGHNPIYRNHHTNYTRSSAQNRPYFGHNKEYGTNGSLTKKQKPNFYSRRMSKMKARQASFSDRVNQRTGRTRTSARGRSGSWGK